METGLLSSLCSQAGNDFSYKTVTKVWVISYSAPNCFHLKSIMALPGCVKQFIIFSMRLRQKILAKDFENVQEVIFDLKKVRNLRSIFNPIFLFKTLASCWISDIEKFVEWVCFVLTKHTNSQYIYDKLLEIRKHEPDK